MKGGGVRIDLIEERTEFFRAGDRPDPRGEAHAIAFEDHSAFRGIVEESNHPIPCGTEAVDEIRSFQHHMGKGSDPLFSINAVDGIFALVAEPDADFKIVDFMTGPFSGKGSVASDRQFRMIAPEFFRDDIFLQHGMRLLPEKMFAKPYCQIAWKANNSAQKDHFSAPFVIEAPGGNCYN